MSILNALGRSPHFDDSAFADLWSRHAAAGTTAAALQDAHLVDCSACRARYASFTGWLDETRADACGEVDELFPADRLTTQQAHIARRLEALDRPARVIAFPRVSHPTAMASRGPQRWVAAAAAAGLIVGLGAGELFNFRRTWPVALDTVAQRSAPVAQSARGIVPVSVMLDDLFLDASESAITSLPVEALQALDAITPRVRDVDQSR